MNDIEVIGLGALNMDHIYRVERILTDGEAPVADYRLAPGGSAANTIYGLAKLGVRTGFLGVVGDDEQGRMLLGDLQSVGVDTGQIRLKAMKTGASFCLTEKRGKRAIYLFPGANSSLSIEDIDPVYVKQAKMLHMSSFADEGQLDIQKQLLGMLPPSVKVSFAPGAIYAAKGLKAIAQIIKKAHILFINRKEAEELTGESFQKGARSLLKQGCHIVAVTLGGGITRGKTKAACYIVSGEGEFIIEAQKAKKPGGDTVGAGDAFAAGFLYGFLQGKDLETCGYWGDLVASFSLTKTGARAGLPTLDELTKHCMEKRENTPK
jgi:ribokinase